MVLGGVRPTFDLITVLPLGVLVTSDKGVWFGEAAP
jgi:hypothetical protein